MSLYTGSGSLPTHQYVWVDGSYLGLKGYLPAVWFGLHSHPGRAWGCHVLLECGAVYRGLPPHAVAFSAKPQRSWSIKDAQRWDCYGSSFSLHRYDYLRGLECRTKSGMLGEYLFTAIPMNDAFTEEPSQSKEFMFVKLRNDRLTILPTNDLLFIERSFTEGEGKQWPKLNRANRIWSSECSPE